MERHQASDTIPEFTRLYPQTYHPQQNPCLKWQCMGSISRPHTHIKENKNHSSEQSLERTCYIDMNNSTTVTGQEQQYVVKSIPSSRNYSHNGFVQMKKPVLRETHLKPDVAVFCKPSNSTYPPVFQTPAHPRLVPANGHQFRSTVVQWTPSASSSQTKTVLNSIQNMKIESSQLNAPTESTSVRTESEESNSTQKSKFSKLQWFCIILAWLITALGVGIYLYVLFAAFSGNQKLLSKGSILVLITVLSNICLLSAVYFHKKIRKYLL